MIAIPALPNHEPSVLVVDATVTDLDRATIRESSRAMGGKNAARTTARGRRAIRSRSRGDGATRAELYAKAKRQHIPGRSKMSKRQLENALR